MSDVIYAATHSEAKYATFKNTQSAEQGIKFVTDFKSRYYIRFTAKDRPGVLAKVAGIFAKYNISIIDLIQKGEDMDTIPIILITHETGELAVRRAMDKIGQLEDVTEVNSVIRVGG